MGKKFKKNNIEETSEERSTPKNESGRGSRDVSEASMTNEEFNNMFNLSVGTPGKGLNALNRRAQRFLLSNNNNNAPSLIKEEDDNILEVTENVLAGPPQPPEFGDPQRQLQFSEEPDDITEEEEVEAASIAFFTGRFDGALAPLLQQEQLSTPAKTNTPGSNQFPTPSVTFSTPGINNRKHWDNSENFYTPEQVQGQEDLLKAPKKKMTVKHLQAKRKLFKNEPSSSSVDGNFHNNMPTHTTTTTTTTTTNQMFMFGQQLQSNTPSSGHMSIIEKSNTPDSDHNMSIIGNSNTPSDHNMSIIGNSNTPSDHNMSIIGNSNTPSDHYMSIIGSGNTPSDHHMSISESDKENTPFDNNPWLGNVTSMQNMQKAQSMGLHNIDLNNGMRLNSITPSSRGMDIEKETQSMGSSDGPGNSASRIVAEKIRKRALRRQRRLLAQQENELPTTAELEAFIASQEQTLVTGRYNGSKSLAVLRARQLINRYRTNKHKCNTGTSKYGRGRAGFKKVR